MVSEIKSILVENSQKKVREEAIDGARRENRMNYVLLKESVGASGNYLVGILEGGANFYQETREWAMNYDILTAK